MPSVNVNYNTSGIVCFMNINGGNADENNYLLDSDIYGGYAITDNNYDESVDGGIADSQYYQYDCNSSISEISDFVDFDKISPAEFAIDLTFTDGIVTLENLSVGAEKFTWLVTSPTLTEVYIKGTQGTIVPIGSKIKSASDATSHKFMEAITISKLNIDKCAIALDLVNVSDNTTYTIIISDANNENAIEYDYISGTDATLEEIMAGLSTAITWPDMDKFITPENYLVLTNNNQNFSITTGIIPFNIYNIATIRAVIEGESTVEIGDLTIIEDEISGFQSVFNATPGVTGHTFTENKTDLSNFVFDLVYSGYYTVQLTGYTALDILVGTEKRIDYLTAYYALM